MLQSLPNDLIQTDVIDASPPAYWYTGRCPQTACILRLPRTSLAEAIAYHLMQQLATDDQYAREGKMYGVLLVKTLEGELKTLKAFSGLLHGKLAVAGWVPPIPGRNQIALEEIHTLATLEAMKQELITLAQLPERQQYETLAQKFATQLHQLHQLHQQHKQERHHQRQSLLETLTGAPLAAALEQLDNQSRRDGSDRRQLKRHRDAALQPLQQVITQANARIQELKQERKQVSRQLQAQMQANYRLTNFMGKSLPLQQLASGNFMPTGTGECCAPKLLHYAATHNLKPLAMAEFWWGPSPSSGDKVQGEFYGACADRCQPLMGFLLSGLAPPQTIELPQRLAVLYQDEWLIAVNKPAGLLSVPGRYRDRQDSVLTRLNGQNLDPIAFTVHRLDQDTSGILLLARDRQTYRHLSHQFQKRQVDKVYEAIVTGPVTQSQGTIDLPLWGDPEQRPCQTVDWQRGKPSVTYFQVMAQAGKFTRLQFTPITGRTHQLRVHAASAEGLGAPILGDRLYGCRCNAERLHLHARELRFHHPQTEQRLHLIAETPF